ncbi:MAG: PilT/PilU family type 4a pilus ATPase, partial [Deltaproteobacteria bacterium]|nr:PilT/PilU family type 4a pilus ATPase [Deltaproteobacteria bacterium]
GGMIGAILVENNLLTDEQRQKCLAAQAKSDGSMHFGEIAVRLGFINKEILAIVLDAQKKYVHQVREEQSRVIPLPAELLEELPEEPSAPPFASERSERQGPGRDHGKEAARLLGWLAAALARGASDLHVMAGKAPILRYQGQLMASNKGALDGAAVESLLASILDEEELRTLKTRKAVVKCVDLPEGGRARCNIFHHLRGMNGVFRLIPEEIPSLVSLNLPSVVGKFTTYAQGLVLVTGPISSGKTTTLAALVDIVNRERRQHIITIENPVEFVCRSKCSLVTQREVGPHTMSFGNALRAALREDPDVIVVGEMNDLDTARLATAAAETGHLVFATLHTQNAVRSINRLLDMFPPEEQGQIRTVLAESLRGAVSQRLVPRADAPGLIPAVEVLVVTPAVRNLIHEKKIYQLRNAMQVSRDAGNMSFQEHANLLLEKGVIAQETHGMLCEA